MILRIDNATTYCDYNEEEGISHDLLIDLSTGKVSTDLNINNQIHNFTEFILETPNEKTEVRVTSLDFLDDNELEYIQKICMYVEPEDNDNDGGDSLED